MSDRPPEAPEQQPLISPRDVVVSGLAGATVAIVTAKLGVTGVLAGATLAPMVTIYYKTRAQTTKGDARWLSKVRKCQRSEVPDART
jgi:hypothetical protein